MGIWPPAMVSIWRYCRKWKSVKVIASPNMIEILPNLIYPNSPVLWSNSKIVFFGCFPNQNPGFSYQGERWQILCEIFNISDFSPTLGPKTRLRVVVWYGETQNKVQIIRKCGSIVGKELEALVQNVSAFVSHFDGLATIVSFSSPNRASWKIVFHDISLGRGLSHLCEST